MDVGARVWLADPADDRVWRSARVLSLQQAPPAVQVELDEDGDGDEGDDKGSDGGKKAKTAVVPLVFKTGDGAGECANVLLQNAADQQDQDDLVALPHLHEAAILHALRLRYARHAIYTHIGDILVSVNPFQRLPALYTRDRMHNYAPDDGTDQPTRRDPHLFAVARAAYVDVARNARNQSILISGESGAGKTEATKIVMKYFALTCGQSSGGMASPPPSAKAATTSIETQVLQSNPILESFGNARTVRNDNSSRFGKFIELQFDPRGGLTLRGARIRTYLLEKIRVIQQAQHERNFHIFYELLATSAHSDRPTSMHIEDDEHEGDLESLSTMLASIADHRRTWGLRSASHFRLLNKSQCMRRRDGVDDAVQFRKTLRAMEQLGLTSQEISSVLEIVAAVLHMGNVEFAETTVRRKNSRNRSVSESDRDNEAVSPLTTVVKVVRVLEVANEDDESDDDEASPIDHFAKAAALLGVKSEQLERALTKRWLHTANETLEVALDVGHAENTRNALSMECYRLLFEWLVGRINAKIHPDAHKSRGCDAASMLSIGLLDIFGFEDMAINSFEQLCINYANEALQHQFNEYVFASEQRLYREEGILAHEGDSNDPNAMSIDSMEFPDNSACLELFEKKPLGLFSLTDQECVFPQGNDRALVAKFYSAFASGENAKSNQQSQQYGRSRSSSTAIGTHSHFVLAGALQRSTHFGVAHYAGRVLYNADGFLAKNKDAFCESAALLLAESSNPLIQSLAITSAAATTAKAVSASSGPLSGRRPAIRRANSSIAAVSVGTQFKLQLGELLEIIRATTPHYVRCIKPNDSSSSDDFDTRRVVEQLRSGGVLEAVRVARAGFPVRLSHDQFLNRYARELVRCHGGGSRQLASIDIKACLGRLGEAFIKQTGGESSTTLINGVRLGKTRVFFRRKPYEALEKLRTVVRSSAAVVAQTQFRGYLARRRYRALLRGVLFIQCAYRGHCARVHTHSIRAHVRAITIQRVARGFCARTSYLKLKSSAILCQSLVRMCRATRLVKGLRETRAATRIATCWRRSSAQKKLSGMLSAILSLQCAFRARVARGILMELKRESRNVMKLQEDNSALKSELAVLRAQLAAMQLQQQQVNIFPMAPTPILRPMQPVMVASALIPNIVFPVPEKEKLHTEKNTEPQEDLDRSQQQDEEFLDDEDEDITSMSIPSFSYQAPGSDSCEESNNNQLLNDCTGARIAATSIAVSACIQDKTTEPNHCDSTAVSKPTDNVYEPETIEKPFNLDLAPVLESESPEKPVVAAPAVSSIRPRRYSLPDMPTTFNLTPTPCNTVRENDVSPPPTDEPEDDEDMVISPRSRDRRHSLDLWIARQEHVEEELQQLREEVRATALAVASSATPSARTPTPEDQKEVIKKYVASQIKAKMMKLQLQEPSSPCLHLDMNLVDNNRGADEDEDDGAVGDDESERVCRRGTPRQAKWRAPASVGCVSARNPVPSTRMFGTPGRRLDTISRNGNNLNIRSRSDALPAQAVASSSSCYAQRARNARTAWNFAGAASVSKSQSTKHSRGLQAYFADDNASDEDEFDGRGEGKFRAKIRELPMPTRSASLGLPPLRGGMASVEDDGHQPIIAVAWTPRRQPQPIMSESQLVPRWAKDPQCTECHCSFGLLVRRHHCRQCGRSFCYEHSTRKLRLPHLGYTEPQRVCDACFEDHLLGLSTCPSGGSPEIAAWRRKRREASIAMAKAAAMGEDPMTRRNTETSSMDSPMSSVK